MPNLFDYLDWRGGLTFAEESFCDVDALCLAELAYAEVWDAVRDPVGMPLSAVARLQGQVSGYPDGAAARCGRFLRAMGQTRRFMDLRACRFADALDRDRGIQFAAVCFDVKGLGRIVSFRGTDGTIVGWHEDFAMFYESPIPAQAEAVAYTRQAAETDVPLILTGHSKGGNLSSYTAVHLPEEIQNRVLAAWSFDGPGLDDRVLSTEAYARIKPRLFSVIPEASFIGLLLGYNTDYKVVRSDGAAMRQHDPFTWQICQPGIFDQVDSASLPSRVIDRSMHECLRRITPAQRETVIESLFRVVESSGATTTAELGAGIKANLPRVLLAVAGIDSETRTVAQSQLQTALISGAANLIAEGATDLLKLGANRVLKRLFGEKQDA